MDNKKYKKLAGMFKTDGSLKTLQEFKEDECREEMERRKTAYYKNQDWTVWNITLVIAITVWVGYLLVSLLAYLIYGV